MLKPSLLFILLTAAACIQTGPPPPAPPPPVRAEPAPAAPAPAAARPDGEVCSQGAECASGVCEGQGCGADQGRCVSNQRMCTMDLVPYCGCDRVTFRASSGCPKRTYASRGECGSSGPPTAGVPAGLPAGAACDTANQCQSGVCEGQGCGSKQGVCAQSDRRCTTDLVAYCGCDGKTFRGSSTCPGRRYERRNTCEAPPPKRPSGASCNVGGDCESGICEGQGCGPGQGVCAPKRRACTRDLRAYCGCDGTTFRASGSCPNRRFRSRGPCK